ncbi:MAG: DUF3990 domain-containing protein [Clostridiales bacterium]|nr:DUF3990 domain-containing protein [Clostridiales bacterium]
MLVYHGTTLIIQKPKIIKSEIGRDFGFAFYTTDIKQQSERWAIRKARIANRATEKLCMPIVNVYEWNDCTSGLSINTFEGTSVKWLDMVVKCRSDITFTRDYDIVIGKIANDNVGETVSYVMQGIMRKEDAIERLKFEKINNQIAFCTEKALNTLVFVDNYIVRS